MATSGPEAVVDAPPRTPPPNGLLNTAAVIEDPEGRWINGIGFQGESCADLTVFDLCSATGDGLGGSGNRPAKVAISPFGVKAFDRCSTFGFVGADYEARARRLLLAGASKAVENEFWRGTLNAGNPKLQNGGVNGGGNITQLASGAAQGIVNGFAALVQAIGDNNLGRGMIHARPYLVNLWVAQGLLRWDNGKLYTYTGNLVVPGTGYPGSSPSGTAPTTTSEWAYATSEVVVYRGGIETPDFNSSVDHTTNTVMLRAEQAYAAAFNNCAIVGVNINPTASPYAATYS